jgi:hypothetical protein
MTKIDLRVGLRKGPDRQRDSDGDVLAPVAYLAAASSLLTVCLRTIGSMGLSM